MWSSACDPTVTGSNPAAAASCRAQAGAGGGLVENLHYLGAEAAGELPVPAERVLAGHPALLVRGSAEREVGLSEQPVVRDDAVASGEDVGQSGSHLPVHRDRAPDAELCPGVGGQAGVRADADDDQDNVGQAGHRGTVGCGGLDLEPCRLARRGAADLLNGGAGEDLDAMAGQLGVDQGAELRVDRGQYLGQLLHLSDGQPAGGQSVGHLQADVAGADNDGTGRGGLLEGAHDGEGVAHRVQQVHPVARPERSGPGQAADRRPHRDRACADHQLVVAEQLIAAIGGSHQQLARAGVDSAGGGVQPQPHPGGFQVGDGAVGEVAPVGDLPGYVVGDAADREVRVGVRDDNGDLGAGIQLAGAQRGTDAGVAAPDRDEVHAVSCRFASY